MFFLNPNKTHFIMRAIVFGLIGIAPFLTISEVVALVAAGHNNNLPTPQLPKMVKDLGYWALMFLGLTLVSKKQLDTPLGKLFIFSCIVITFFALKTVLSYPIMGYLGLRWILPALLIFPFMNIASRDMMEKLAKICSILFLVQLCLQIIEYFKIGLLNRPPGFFATPNTTALFALVSLVLMHYFAPKQRDKILMHLLVPISLYLTLSGTGYFVWFTLVFLLLLWQPPKKGIYITLPLSIIISWTLMLLIVPRINYIQGSLAPRIDFFIQALEQITIFPDYFGKAANATWRYYPELQQTLLPFGTDSMFTVILYNTQLLGLLGVCILVGLWTHYLIEIKSKQGILLTGIIGLFSCTTDVLEVFPINIIIALWVAYLLNQKKQTHGVPLCQEQNTPLSLSH